MMFRIISINLLSVVIGTFGMMKLQTNDPNLDLEFEY